MTAELEGISLRVEPDDVAPYLADQSGHVGEAPIAVASPRTVEAVQQLLRYATKERVPVVPRGAGTGLSAGACPTAGSLVLDLSRMNRIVELDPTARLAVVEAGVVNAAVSAAAAPHGLMYAPDPSSWESSTIGGNVATNAGGLRCARYGATRTSVLGLDVVLADGRLLRTGGRTIKRSAGYDMTQLFIGSEGTLGVVVGATLKLIPLPAPQVTALATFTNVSDAARAAEQIAASTTPTLLELMDAGVVRALDDTRGTGFGRHVGAVLLVQSDDQPHLVAHLEAALVRGHMMVTSDPAEAKELLDIRRAVFPALQQQGRLLVEDVCVPVSNLARMVDAVVEIAARHRVPACTVAHAADGNLHPVLIGDDPAVARAADEIFRTAQALGGTVSGEHGIGRLKRDWLSAELGEVGVDVQVSIKRALDPLGLLNPGALFR